MNEPSLKDIWDKIDFPCKRFITLFHAASDHSQRLFALEGILEYCYGYLVTNRHLNKDHSEDALTIQIVGQLQIAGLWASHDTQVGGHCDIVVIGPDHFLWLAEAKIYGSYEKLRAGFLQLSTRYATGGYGQNHGELIIYCRSPNALGTLEKWMDFVCETPEVRVEIVEKHTTDLLWFRTRHQSKNTGTDFCTRHRIVPMFWSPMK